jgi:hypothetical protein
VLFPDEKNFQAPDRPRAVFAVLARMFGQQLKPGDEKDPTRAMERMRTESKSTVAKLDTNPDYSLRDGLLWGLQKAFRNLKPIPRTTAQLDLCAVLRQAGVTTTDEAVDYFLRCFLRLPLEAGDRAQLVAFLREQVGGDRLDYERSDLEKALRELVHLILSTPEYQLA